MTVITISRQVGSYGEEIAAGVAQELGLRLVNAETINQAAQKAGVPQTALAEWRHEGERGPATQVLKALRAMPSTVPLGISTVDREGSTHTDQAGLTLPFAGLFSPLARPISASIESYVRMVDWVIRGLASEGDVLIAGRGGQVLLKSYPGALHLQIVAPFAFRCEVLMTRSGLDKRTVQNQLRASDRARFDYLRRYHDADWLDPTLYHLVINTGWVSISTAIDLIVSTQKTLKIGKKPQTESD